MSLLSAVESEFRSSCEDCTDEAEKLKEAEDAFDQLMEEIERLEEALKRTRKMIKETEKKIQRFEDIIEVWESMLDNPGFTPAQFAAIRRMIETAQRLKLAEENRLERLVVRNNDLEQALNRKFNASLNASALITHAENELADCKEG